MNIRDTIALVFGIGIVIFTVVELLNLIQMIQIKTFLKKLLNDTEEIKRKNDINKSIDQILELTKRAGVNVAVTNDATGGKVNDN